ncbi:MAG: ABC transporter ATP-binding protein [Desulfosalsimonadaceae bacterium]
MTSNAHLLAIDSISKAFGGVQAIDTVSFTLSAESITGLIGPNGAGKTTLFNLVTGIFPTDSGDILFKGESIHEKAVHELVDMGLGRTFQNVELFSSMSVLENVLVGLHTRTSCGIIGSVLRTRRLVQEERRARERALELLDFVGLADLANQRSSDLPFGWQRLLELARALASEPALLLLDEPAAGLNMGETDTLGELIESIRKQGITVLLVEHDMALTMKTCDRIVVLDRGKKIAEGPPRAIQSDEAVMAAYLGKPK